MNADAPRQNVDVAVVPVAGGFIVITALEGQAPAPQPGLRDPRGGRGLRPDHPARFARAAPP